MLVKARFTRNFLLLMPASVETDPEQCRKTNIYRVACTAHALVYCSLYSIKQKRDSSAWISSCKGRIM